MQALQAAKTAFDELPECVTSLLSADQPCQKLLLPINSHIESHGDLYVAASLQPLEAESGKLRSWCKGCPDGARWDQDIPAECSWEFLLTNTASLASLDKMAFISLIRSVGKVFAS